MRKIQKFIIIFGIISSISLYAKNSKETLESSKMVQGTTFSAGSVLTTNDDGYLVRAVLGADQKIMDENYKSSMTMTFPKGSTLIFGDPINAFGKPNDRPDMVREIRTTGDVKIGRITFPSGSTLYVTGGFMETNGKRSYYADVNGQIFQDMKVGKTTIPAKSNVLIDHKGKIKYAEAGSWDWIVVK